MIEGINAAGLVNDAMAASLEQRAKSTTDQAELASKVDSMFTSILIKTMRQTLGEEGLFPGDKSDALGGIFDHYMADQIASSGGMGLGQLVVGPLKQTSETGY